MQKIYGNEYIELYSEGNIFIFKWLIVRKKEFLIGHLAWCSGIVYRDAFYRGFKNINILVDNRFVKIKDYKLLLSNVEVMQTFPSEEMSVQKVATIVPDDDLVVSVAVDYTYTDFDFGARIFFAKDEAKAWEWLRKGVAVQERDLSLKQILENLYQETEDIEVIGQIGRYTDLINGFTSGIIKASDFFIEQEKIRAWVRGRK